jgi:glycosyltransferase involved in cell wall biosynthesis
MKIAHIAPPWITIPPKNYGGTEIVLYNLIEEQIAQGHDVTLLAPGDAKTSARLVSFFAQSLIDAGVPWQGHLKAFYHTFKAVEYIKEHRFDILHTHLSSGADMYVYPLAANVDTPHVATLHSRFPFDRVQTWTGDADNLYMEWIASVPFVAISESARDEVRYPLNFVGVVHHGLPMGQFKPTVEQPEDFFFWLGRIVPDKGAHLAIQAAKEAGVRLILAGTVDTHVRESVDYFENCIKPHIDGDQIQYIGPATLQQKIDLFSRARGFLNPIQWEEPFGIVMIEAMAVGCPVIAIARGAAHEIVEHGKTGFLVHDVHELTQFIHHIDRIDRTTVRATAIRRFSVTSMARKYSTIYKKVMATFRTSRIAARRITAGTRADRSSLPTPPLIKADVPVLAPYSMSPGSPKKTMEAEPQS